MGGDQGEEWAGADFYAEMAQALERACFDYMIFEDTQQVSSTYGGNMEYTLRRALGGPQHDPMPFLPVIADQTSRIGVVATASTSFMPPYLLARQAVTIDNLTGGRSGVNLVTSSSHEGAQNYGFDQHREHDLRYEIADEWTDLVTRLWDSWDPDALVIDHEKGVYTDPTKVRHVNFEGRFFKSRGPLNMHPGPQHRPVICQAGGSAAGRDFGAKYADTIIAQPYGVEEMKAYRADITERALRFGRDPKEIKVLFVVNPILGETEADALAQRAAINAAVAEQWEDLLERFSYFTGIDFKGLDPDAPLPTDLRTNGHQHTLDNLIKASPGKTVRELAQSFRITESVELVGTPATVAQRMGEVMDEVGGDGYVILGPVTRRYISEIADGLAPELMRRGLTRSSYSGTTLREHLSEF